MNILITGADGFVGRNLKEFLKQERPGDTIFSYDIDSPPDSLSEYCKKADFVFHLAGVNRPKDDSEFITGNIGLTETALSYCKEGKKPPVLLSSSVQASLDNPYGKSKKAGEDAALAYEQETGSPAYVFRLPGIFGKWCRPDYNSVVATFCHNIANGLPIEVRDAAYELKLIYIDDVCRAFLDALCGRFEKDGDYCKAGPVYSITLGDLADTLRSFRMSRRDLHIPDMSDAFTRKLHSTYQSYLPDFSYSLSERTDERGSFTEFFRTADRGQTSVNVTKPGVTKGNHWHHTKTEKFFVVSGEGIVRFRKVGENDIKEYPVSCGDHKMIDIPPGYVHSIENTGAADLVTIMWANELFDPQKPDTFPDIVV